MNTTNDQDAGGVPAKRSPKRTLTTSRRLGWAIRQARRELGWSQEELSAASGVSRPQISDIESAKSSPRTTTLFELLRALDYELEIRPLESGSRLDNALRRTTDDATS